ncbi:MAG TPA: pyridoxamine 5'-phosphate oxidase family protein [Acidimicrobiales bacterium]|nr:pyridoxamine 5'-phosphate oxidase family protein [Acidimicrobiales bacterium]
MSEITTTDELRAIYRPPGAPALRKQHAAIDDHDRAFIAHAPFVIVATSDTAGRCDVSPKGGPPGFVTVLDDGTVVIPDLAGNNRLDSLQNLLDNAGIGLLFLIPGIDETLRVNGRARLSTDPTVLATSAVGGVVPKVAIAVDVEEAYIHCAKALRRGSVWQAEQWPDTSDMPSVACMLRDQVAPEVEVEVIAQALEDGYERTMWQTGG